MVGGLGLWQAAALSGGRNPVGGTFLLSSTFQDSCARGLLRPERFGSSPFGWRQACGRNSRKVGKPKDVKRIYEFELLHLRYPDTYRDRWTRICDLRKALHSLKPYQYRLLHPFFKLLFVKLGLYIISARSFRKRHKKPSLPVLLPHLFPSSAP